MIFDNSQSDLYKYCEEHSDRHSQLLDDLYRETYLRTMKPRMASGLLQGRILSLISKLKRPKHIVEIGTFTGYAALCMAEGLHEDGRLTTIEVNPELSYISSKYFNKSSWADQINSRVGNALEILPTLPDGIDMVFIDAKKRDYIKYYDLIIDKVSKGGLVLADNILWDGKVADITEQDKTTMAIREFNTYVKNDDRVCNVILPLRDGVNVLMKK